MILGNFNDERMQKLFVIGSGSATFYNVIFENIVAAAGWLVQ